MDVYGLRLSFIYTYASDPLIFKYLSPIASNLPFSKSWVKLRSPIRVLRVCWACDISGGAGWWKSPCPDLVRASGEQSPGATRHRGFLAAQDLAHFERPLSGVCDFRTSAASRMGARGGSLFSCRPPAGRCSPAGVGQVWLSAHPFFLAGMLIVTSSTKPVNSESSASLKTSLTTGVASSTPTSAVSSAE